MNAHRKKVCIAVAVLGLTVMLLFTLGTGVNLKAAPTVVPKGKLVAACGTLAQMIMDGNLQTVGLHMPIFGHLYDGLLAYNLESELMPWLATSWRMAADGSYWEYEIRRGVKFHNGEDLTAEDVKATYDRILRLKRNECAPTLIRAGLRTEVVDDYTVRFYTNAPMVIFPTTFSGAGYGCITPKDYIEKVGDKEFGEKPVGTGPYKLVQRKMGESIEMEANENYWHPDPQYQPGIKNVVLKVIPELSTKMALIKTGEAQLADGITGALINVVKGTPGIKTISAKGTAFGTIRIFDHEDAAALKGSPFYDVRVRRALNYAVDKDLIVQKIYFGEASPLRGNFLMAAFGYNPEWPLLYPHDQEKAKKLLAEAGYPNGFSTELNFYVSSSWPLIPECMEAVAGMWKKVGVKATLRQWESGTYFAKFRDRTMRGIAAESMTGGATEAGEGGRVFWYGKGSYSTVWNNKELDGILNEELSSLAPDRRKGLIDKARQIICIDKCYDIFLVNINTVYAASEKLDWIAQPGTPYLVGLGRARWK